MKKLTKKETGAITASAVLGALGLTLCLVLIGISTFGIGLGILALLGTIALGMGAVAFKRKQTWHAENMTVAIRPVEAVVAPEIAWCAVLGLKLEGLTLAELKRAYRERARTLHPDHNDGNDERMKELVAAYDGLKHNLVLDEIDKEIEGLFIQIEQFIQSDEKLSLLDNRSLFQYFEKGNVYLDKLFALCERLGIATDGPINEDDQKVIDERTVRSVHRNLMLLKRLSASTVSVRGMLDVRVKEARSLQSPLTKASRRRIPITEQPVTLTHAPSVPSVPREKS